MRSRRNRNRKMKRKAAVMILTAAVTLFSLIVIEKRVKNYSAEMGTYYCRQQLSESINKAVCSVLENTGAEYSDIAVDIYDINGKFVSSEIRTKNVNMIQGMIISEINQGISGISESEMKISAGTLSGLSLLNGMGPKIRLRIIPVGSAHSEMCSSFESAGINQVCHKIYLDITAEVRTVCPSGSETVDVNMKCMIAENIIAGEVPGGIISHG